MSVNKRAHTDTNVINVETKTIKLALQTALSLDAEFILSGIPPNRYMKRSTLKRLSWRLLLYEVWVFATNLFQFISQVFFESSWKSISVAYWNRGLVFDNTSLIRVGDVLSSTLKFVINDQYDEKVRKNLKLSVT